MKFTLERKILTGFVACSLILLVVAVFSFRNSEEFVSTSRWVTHTHEVLYKLEEVLVGSVDAQSGVRGFLITNDDEYLLTYRNAKDNLTIHLNKLRELIVDNPQQVQNVNKIDSEIQKHIEFLERCVALHRKEGFETVSKLIRTGEGKRILESVRKDIAASKRIEHDLLSKRTTASDEDLKNFNLIFITLLVVIAIVLVVVYLIIIANIRAIKKAEAETANKNWSLNGGSDLVKNMQGNKLLPDLCQNIINHLAGYINAQLGAIYVTQEDAVTLKLHGAHAIAVDKHKETIVTMGQGLVGQAAAEKRVIEVNRIPDGYFKVKTSFGEVGPRTIIAIPIVYEDNVIGVIELASINEFSSLHKEYIGFVIDSIAIAIISAQSREKTKILLEETQRQAEELETQQEELKQSNEELSAKTDLLERSEAELKTQKEELRQSNDELEEKANLLVEQNARLEIVKTEIEVKAQEVDMASKYKSEFLANMSHELRTPLNGILILSQLLYENKNNTLGNKEVEFAKNIHGSGTDLLNLINEILDLSKVEAGKIQLDIGEAPVKGIVMGMTSLFTEIAKSKGVEFSISINEPLPETMFTDRQRVEQILKNILSNAFKFTESGGKVSMHVQLQQNRAGTERRHLDDSILFKITDTGIGIPKDKHAAVFEAFQQADGTTKRKYGGTGLGLSISKKLARVLGGDILLESERGAGSTFSIVVPVLFDSSLSVQPAPTLEVKTNGKAVVKEIPLPVSEPEVIHVDDRSHLQSTDKVILIVDDNEAFANLVLDIIRKRNFKGLIAKQGNTGLSYARHYKPYAILLDIKLPVMDGIEVLKQIKNDPDLRHTPVQVISAANHRLDSLRFGAFGYLGKPVTVADLELVFNRLDEFYRKDFKKLLIVEDNEIHNLAIQEVISGNDVKCFPVYRGSDALSIMKEENFDCVIVDLGLPDMSGFELMEQMKADSRMSKIPIIVYTGRDLKREEISLLEKMASTVILKTASSKERLLDETMLLLHRVESKLSQEKQKIIRQLHGGDDVLKNRKVLMVDDDIRNIYSLTNVLEDEGIICYTAENGKVALKVLAENPEIELVLMDVMMPEMDGYETTIEIRKSAEFSKLPIIALTAKAMKGDKEKCLAVGMTDYISKPVNIEQLLSLMRVCLYRY